MGITLATILWRWIKRHNYDLKRWEHMGTLKSDVLFCSGPSMSCGVRFPYGFAVDLNPKRSHVLISKFQKQHNRWRSWKLNAAEPDFFEKLEYHIKTKMTK